MKQKIQREKKKFQAKKAGKLKLRETFKVKKRPMYLQVTMSVLVYGH